MILFAGLVIIALAVYAVIRRVDVRLALLLAALALGAISNTLPAIIQKFFSTLVAAEFVIPICCAMGFAYVLRHTGCDKHLVHLLIDPLRRVHYLLVPGAILVGFIANTAIISQVSTAVAVGSVLIPILLAARISPETAGAALLIGASIGGELLNPGAPEFRTIISEARKLGVPLDSAACAQAIWPLLLVHVPITTALFWWQSVRAEKRWKEIEPEISEAAKPLVPHVEDDFKVSYLRAAVPLVPLILLMIIGKPLEIFTIPHDWLVGAKENSALLEKASKFLEEPRLSRATAEVFDSRLIGAAMLVGVLCAALAVREKAGETAKAFFEGAGYAYANIISIIVAASCFGEGVKSIGLDKVIGAFVEHQPGALLPLAGFVPLAFGAVSGSGMAATQSLAGFFIAPGYEMGLSPAHSGAFVAIGAAAGRTMSLVAAVTLMSSQLTGVPPARLVRRVAPPLLAGTAAAVIAAMLRG
jgi:C4-dicarboxylate transporter, DcuC family